MIFKNIIFIAGGSFQGKSLISLKLAAKFNFSGVITTDMIRNILFSQNPEAKYLATSTYLLNEMLLNKQKESVSNIISELLKIYEKRGEKIIFEGMHFSDSFLESIAKKPFLKIVINNKTPLSDRLIYKGLTRNKLSLNDNSFDILTKANVENSRYMKYSKRIQQIHSELRSSCVAANFKLIVFNNIEDGIKQISNEYNIWNKGDNNVYKKLPR